MKRVDFKYLSARNFLCFGPEGVEIHLTKLGPIVTIQGRNYDDIQASGKPGSNGTGKSSIQEILVWGLFGKTVKRKLTQAEIVHNKVGGKTEVVVRWDDFQVVRGIKPSKLQLFEWKDNAWDEISAGAGINETQRMIEARLGMNHKTFVSIVCFDDRNSNSYLECDTETQRAVVDNLLSLEKYRAYAAEAKDREKEAKRRAQLLLSEVNQCETACGQASQRLAKIQAQQEQWRTQQRDTLARLETLYGQKKTELHHTDVGAKLLRWQEAQVNIARLNEDILRKEEEQQELEGMIAATRQNHEAILKMQAQIRDTRTALSSKVQAIQTDIDQIKGEIRRLENRETGVPCNSCGQEIPTGHYAPAIEMAYGRLHAKETELQGAQVDLAGWDEPWNTVVTKKDFTEGVLASHARESSTIGREIGEYRARISREASLPKPEEDAETRVIEEQLASLRTQIEAKRAEVEGLDPYHQNLLDAEQELGNLVGRLREKKGEADAAERLVPYYSYWVKAFGDDGIRKFVIEGVTEALNQRVAHWMNVLIYGNISLTFNDKLEPTITRIPAEGEDFTYYGMSGGEQRRLNLALTQAFAHIMMLNSGCSTNLMFLDEVSINIDENGIEAVYQMILQLAEEGRQVFVTTHDPALLGYLQGCSTLTLEKREGFTRVA